MAELVDLDFRGLALSCTIQHTTDNVPMPCAMHVGLDSRRFAPTRGLNAATAALADCGAARQKAGPSPGADVATASPVPAQMWAAASPVPAQMWQRPSPVPAQMWQR